MQIYWSHCKPLIAAILSWSLQKLCVLLSSLWEGPVLPHSDLSSEIRVTQNKTRR